MKSRTLAVIGVAVIVAVGGFVAQSLASNHSAGKKVDAALAAHLATLSDTEVAEVIISLDTPPYDAAVVYQRLSSKAGPFTLKGCYPNSLWACWAELTPKQVREIAKLGSVIRLEEKSWAGEIHDS